MHAIACYQAASPALARLLRDLWLAGEILDYDPVALDSLAPRRRSVGGSRRPRAGSRTRRSPRVEQVEPRLAVDGDQPLQQAVARLDGRPAVGAVAGLVHAPLAGVAPLVLREHSVLPRARDRQRAKAAERDPALPLN